MVDYEPFPTGSGEVDMSRSLVKKVIGCVGCGGLGVVGGFVALAFLFGGVAASTSSCEINTDPGQGTASQRLPVRVVPSTGLAPGGPVRVTSEAFDEDAIVGVAVCLRSADTKARGVAACDENQGARYATDHQGRLDVSYAIPRVITVAGKPYDCARAAKRCIVVAADGNDYNRSGGQAISFQRDLPAPDMVVVAKRPVSDHLTIGANPAGPIAPGTDLTVLASGFQPGEPLLVAHCTDELETKGVGETCDPDDPHAAFSAIAFRSLSGTFLRADAQGAVSLTAPACEFIRPIGADFDQAVDKTSEADNGCHETGDAVVACSKRPGRCTIVIAAAADTKRSAVLPYTVAR